MADKDLVYRLIIKDDGTPVLRKVAVEAEKTGAAVTSAQAKAAASTAAKPPQFSMTPQMKANADFWMGPAAKFQEESVKKTTSAIKEQVVEASNLERIMERIQRTVAAFVAVWAFQKITQGISSIIKGGLEFNAVMEESKLGMSAIFMAQGSFAGASGQALEGIEALNAAMEMSSKISKELQLDNLKTAATYQQLVKAYQQTIAPGLAVGFDPEQIRQYTVGMVQAASALGLNLDMLAEETRSMLKGTITPRNTLIATALGIRNEDINKYKGDVDGLYKYIMGRLSAFGVAGEAVQTTWKGAMSNVKDVIQMALGEGFTNLFEYLKKQALNIQGILVKWDIGGPKLDQEVVSVFKSMGQAIIEIIEGTKTWVNSLSGILPIFGLIYQLLRTIFLVLTPIIQGLGVILNVVGFIAEGVSKILKGFNDLITSSKASYPIFVSIAAVIGMYATSFMNATKFGTMLVTVLKFTAINAAYVATFLAGWGPPILAAIAILGLLSTVFPTINSALKESWGLLGKLVEQSELYRVAVIGISAAWMITLGPMGKIAAALLLISEMIDRIKKSGPMSLIDKTSEKVVNFITGTKRTSEQTIKLNTQMADIGMGQLGANTSRELGEQAKFKARIVELDQQQQKELMKIVDITGELTEYDRRRMTELNDVTLLYKDSYGELHKQIDLINSGKFEMPKFEGVGDTTYLEKQITDWDTLISKVPRYAEDMADLPLELQLSINKIAMMWKDMGIPPELRNKWMEQILEITKEKIVLRVGLEINNIDSQIASQNKNYSEQRRLVDEITKAQMRQIELDHKMTPELAAAKRREAEQRKREILIQQNMEELGWISQIHSGEAYQAEFMGNIRAQIAAERNVMEAKILTARAGLGVRDETGMRLQEQAEAAERLKFELDAVRRIQLDYLNHQSKIQPLTLNVATNVGDYREQAAIEMQIYKTKIETLAASAGINIERLKEIAGLEGILAVYTKEDTLAKGLLKDAQDKLDLELRFATAIDDSVGSLSVQRKQSELVTQELERQLKRAVDYYGSLAELSGGESEFLTYLRTKLRLTKEVNEAEAKRRELELGFTQGKETLTFQSNIAELTGDWDASKIIEGELLKIEKDRAIAIGNLSKEGKLYAEQAYRIKMEEIEAQRTLNVAKLEEIGMAKYAAKLHQDIADQYTNLIPNAIDTTMGAFGNFIESIGDGTKSIGDSFRAFFDDLRKSFLRLWIDIAMTALKMQVMKNMGFGQNLGMNLVSAAIGGAAGGAAGGGAYNSYGINTAGDMGTGGFATNFPGRASGGPVSAGNSYWVGEQGKPEIFTPGTSGKITPISAVGGPSKVTVQIINESGGDKLEATKSDIQFKPDEYIISVVLDAAQRNKMGFRDVMGGSR